jgi:hypothetical protein
VPVATRSNTSDTSSGYHQEGAGSQLGDSNEKRDDALTKAKVVKNKPQEIVDHYLFHEATHRKILSLVNESTILDWEPNLYAFKVFHDLFDYDKTNETDANQTMLIWTDDTRHLVVSNQALCSVSKQFKESGSVKKHALIVHLNENWGALSTPVPNRTVNWGDLEEHWMREGCTKADIMVYLDHENTLAMFTVQHQAFDHPKVHSIPLGLNGVWEKTRILNLMRKPPLNRTQLLMVNAHETDTRRGQIQAVLKSFNGTGLNNTYGIHRLDEYYDEMRRSKFIMCPSGLGWDTYRMWEAFYLGVIPVVERYNRRDGWHRTMDGLPIVWVETFEQDLNPAFLESEYEKIATHSSEYNFEKLTIPYWKSFVESFLPQT